MNINSSFSPFFLFSCRKDLCQFRVKTKIASARSYKHANIMFKVYCLCKKTVLEICHKEKVYIMLRNCNMMYHGWWPKLLPSFQIISCWYRKWLVSIETLHINFNEYHIVFITNMNMRVPFLSPFCLARANYCDLYYFIT